MVVFPTPNSLSLQLTLVSADLNFPHSVVLRLDYKTGFGKLNMRNGLSVFRKRKRFGSNRAKAIDPMAIVRAAYFEEDWENKKTCKSEGFVEKCEIYGVKTVGRLCSQVVEQFGLPSAEDDLGVLAMFLLLVGSLTHLLYDGSKDPVFGKRYPGVCVFGLCLGKVNGLACFGDQSGHVGELPLNYYSLIFHIEHEF